MECVSTCILFMMNISYFVDFSAINVNFKEKKDVRFLALIEMKVVHY